LINDSLFPASPDALLVIRVSAIEVLFPTSKRGDDDRTLLSKLTETLEPIETAPAAKELVRDTLRRSAEESIGEACRRRITELLGAERVKEFTALYNARSRPVHLGKGRGGNSENASKALALATELIYADLGFAPGPVPPPPPAPESESPAPAPEEPAARP